jgi:hypothetical protein
LVVDQVGCEADASWHAPVLQQLYLGMARQRR